MVPVTAMRVRGVDIMEMHMIATRVRVTMAVRIMCGCVRGAVRVLLCRSPALGQQNDAHAEHEQARCEAQDWKQPLGHEESRGGERCESQDKHAQRVCDRHGN